MQSYSTADDHDDDEHGAHAHDDGGNHAPPGVGKYVTIFIALCVLTAISFAVGNSKSLRENSPGVMIAMMMAVSSAKAMLVILFFMHLKWEANWKYVLTIPASIMSVFLGLMLVPDIGRRTLYYTPERWLYAAEPHPGRSGDPHVDLGPSMHNNENIDAEKAKNEQ